MERGYKEKEVIAKIKNRSKRIALVLTYNRTLPNVKDLITRNWNISHTNQGFQHIFNKLPSRVYRRNKSLPRFTRKQEHS